MVMDWNNFCINIRAFKKNIFFFSVYVNVLIETNVTKYKIVNHKCANLCEI